MISRLDIVGAVAWLLCFGALVIGLPAQGAPTEQGASHFIREGVNETIAILQAQDLSADERGQRLRGVLRRDIAVGEIGQIALGAFAESVSASERSAYREAFEAYFLLNLSNRIAPYAKAGQSAQAGTVEIAGTRQASPDSSDIVVGTKLHATDRPPLPIQWRVSQRGNRPIIVDVWVFGVSQAHSLRHEFAAIITRKGLDGLVAAMAGRAAKLSAALEIGLNEPAPVAGVTVESDAAGDEAASASRNEPTGSTRGEAIAPVADAGSSVTVDDPSVERQADPAAQAVEQPAAEVETGHRETGHRETGDGETGDGETGDVDGVLAELLEPLPSARLDPWINDPSELSQTARLEAPALLPPVRRDSTYILKGTAEADSAGLAAAMDAFKNGDYPSALHGFRAEAHRGNPFGQYNLAVFYTDDGLGVPQDYVEAAKWYHLAAEQGHKEAQVKLGLMYAYGYGVSKDRGATLKWFKMAAEQGDMDAQYNVGFMYRVGRDVPRNDAEAARWYRRAAEQGSRNAQAILGVMLAKGEGVRRSRSEAIMWLKRAAQGGHIGARHDLDFLLKTPNAGNTAYRVK